ncbi:Poly-beta-1,6-N-acetyl-D-glucosamine export protein [Halomonadaceae bacterium LMG 33818]|uniref:poly-beta-1,6 N-acetyl-D-glucosamine export porin PgaA n=1 Tax=Cernens ardua TaxID=3402176 RepID=UPI003EDB798E
MRKKIILATATSCLLLISENVLAVDNVYDKFIKQARHGEYTNIFSWFDHVSTQRALTGNEIADWLEISLWANHNREATVLWQQYAQKVVIPERGEIAAARAYRNLGHYPTAIRLWQMILRSDPGNDSVESALIFTLADAKQYGQAVSLAEERIRKSPSAQHWRELAWVQTQAGHNAAALDAISYAHEIAPGDRDIGCDYSAILDNNRIGKPSLEAARQCGAPEAVIRRRELAAAAELVRQSLASPTNDTTRFETADHALSVYHALLVRWKNDPTAQGVYRDARIDRLGALVARVRMKEVVSEYQQLTEHGQTIPDYAKQWVAAAYLYLHHPTKAQALYKSAYASNPIKDGDRTSDLYYSLSESEHLKQATQLVDKFKASQPYYLYLPGTPVPQDNNDWLAAQQLTVSDMDARNKLPEAQHLQEHLFNTAPGNQGLGISLASIYQERMWPHRSELLLKRIEGLEPRNVGLEIQQAYTALALQEWKQADELTDDVVARMPENSSVERLDRIRDVHHMWELQIDSGYGLNSSDNSNGPKAGKHDLSLDATLYTPPIDENWRLFTGYTFGRGEFEEGKGIQNNQKFGVEFTNRDNWVQAQTTHVHYRKNSRVGWGLTGWHQFGDHWRVGADAEHLMTSTPLRALHHGITSNGGNLFLQWTGNERQSWNLSTSRAYFSDGNHHQEYDLSGQQRVYTRPYLTVDFTPQLSFSSNTHTGTYYYSPKRDLSVIPMLTADHILYRRYQTEWHQEFVAGAGTYWQKHHGSGLAATLGYGQRLLFNDVLDVGAMLTWSNQPYDGTREKDLTLSFDMSYRF